KSLLQGGPLFRGQTSYDAVRRYASSWTKTEREASAAAYVPLSFDPGEAYQFDWSHEVVLIDGVTTTVKVAHVRLCYSRMLFVRAYPRESQEMVFDAHDKAFAFFGGACARDIYDNMKTAVDTIFVGRNRAYNRRFQQMCGHYLVDPVACTPASGWEKGQVENQVGVVRRRFFVPRPRFKSYAELNAWLEDRCVAWAKSHPHPEMRDRTTWEVFEEEQPNLVPYAGRFDRCPAGDCEAICREGLPRRAGVSIEDLSRAVRQKNRYSVDARAVGRAVEVRAYAERIGIWQDGKIVGEHDRAFGRGKNIYNPVASLPQIQRIRRPQDTGPFKAQTGQRSENDRCSGNDNGPPYRRVRSLSRVLRPEAVDRALPVKPA
ncbi:integrase catalytic subunit, partial [Roseivivax marinus]